MKGWASRLGVSREAILSNCWIRPFVHRLVDPSLWHLNRRSASRGVATGLFAGFLIPIGQIALAAVLSLGLRANVLISATATLVSNPRTFPPIYYAAYWLGRVLLRADGYELTADEIAASAQQATASTAASDWTLLNMLVPLGIGLFVFATVSSALGYVLAQQVWTISVRRRWRKRSVRHSVSASRQSCPNKSAP